MMLHAIDLQAKCPPALAELFAPAETTAVRSKAMGRSQTVRNTLWRSRPLRPQTGQFRRLIGRFGEISASPSRVALCLCLDAAFPLKPQVGRAEHQANRGEASLLLRAEVSPT